MMQLSVLDEIKDFEEFVYFKKYIFVVFGDFGVGKSFIVCYFVGEKYIFDYVFMVEEFYIKLIIYRNRVYEF